MSDETLLGEAIASYSRAEAIAEGTLIDAGALAREAGIAFPVALTRDAWHGTVALTDAARAVGQDEIGRLWDVLWLCAVHGRNAKSERFAF